MFKGPKTNYLLPALAVLIAGCSQPANQSANSEPSEPATSNASEISKGQALPAGALTIAKDAMGGAAPAVGVQGKSWVLNVVNRTNTTFKLAQTRSFGGSWGRWFPIPTLNRTCSLGSYEACFDAKAWQTILSQNCDGGGFDIRIATQPDSNGNATGAEFLGISPNCNYAGGVIGIDP